MMENVKRNEVQLLLYSHELLFAANIAIAYTLLRAVLGLFGSLLNLGIRMNGFLHFNSGANVGKHLAFFTLAALFTCGLFLLVWAAARKTPLDRIILCWVAGIASLGVAPATWLLIFYKGPSDLWSDVSPNLFLIEASIAVSCALLYLMRRLLFPAWASVFLLTAHALFWTWGFWKLLGFQPVTVLFPLIAFCSSLIWLVYVSRQLDSR